jgi:hypothetical protein
VNFFPLYIQTFFLRISLIFFDLEAQCDLIRQIQVTKATVEFRNWLPFPRRSTSRLPLSQPSANKMSSARPENSQNPARISFHPISEDPSASHHLIYFITGNPGLISYYNTFFQTLHELFTSSPVSNSDIFHIHGQSLAGFEDAASESFTTTPYSLEDQISLSLSTLQSLYIPLGPKKHQLYTSIILIGHSVGSYILLELINRLRKSSSTLTIKAGILLFPTVTHIAQSPSGIKISTLLKIPDFPRRASFLARNLVSLVPRNWLKWLVGVVTKMPEDAAEVTTRFLRSRMGIWQAL